VDRLVGALRLSRKNYRLALFVLAALLCLSACGSSGGGTPYSVAATSACLKQRPESVSANELTKPSSARVRFYVSFSELIRTAAPPLGGPLGDGEVYGVDALPAGTRKIGLIFIGPRTFYLNTAAILFFANEDAARRLYASERRHIHELESSIDLDSVTQQSRNVMILWQRDRAPASWIRIVSSCLRTS
jgi:hypothetical protein